MRLLHIIYIVSVVTAFLSCEKATHAPVLPDGSVSFHQQTNQDTIEMPLSILKDSIIVLDIQASLSGSTNSSGNWVTFAVDPDKINDYREVYGEATLLPTGSYVFFKPTVQIPNGAKVSDVAELNIGRQTRLNEYTTYVLPVVIQSVDGQTEGPATESVRYYVFKTGRPAVINKNGWTIADYSSHFNTFVPQNLLDNSLTTYWTSNITQQMPQWVTINFNRQITFSAISYGVPSLLNYPTQGGYPTSIQIETSLDGQTWVDNGIYEGNINNNSQTLPTGLTTATHLRFKVLSAVSYAAVYQAIFINDITLLP